ncbi:MAG: SWIM zinc finger family protein [Bacillota bacterium]
MNLNNFKKVVNKKILSRGYDYYVDGNIAEAFKKRDNEYLFVIEGTHDYQVVVELGQDGEILHSRCDCPYDFGPICKHEAAAYYQLGELVKHPEKERELTKVGENQTIRDVLRNLSKEELIHIIMDITNTDGVLENSLMLKYSEGKSEQELESCQKLIDEIVRKYTGSSGFIDLRDTSHFTSELETVLQKAKDTVDSQLAADISLLLLEEVLYSFQYADDSSGEIGHLVGLTLQAIEETAVYVQDDNREKIFMKLLAFSESESFDGWEDYRIDLLSICFIFGDDEDFRERLRSSIESLLRRDSDEDYSKYERENLLQLLYDLIDQYGTEEEATQFTKDHLHFSSFREQLLEQYLQQQKFEEVIEIALKGEAQDEEYAGRLKKWKTFRYRAYASLEMRQEQQMLAKEMFLSGDLDYYHELKVLGGNHEGFYEDLKQELKDECGLHNHHLFLKLIEEENDLEELMMFVRENTRLIEKYAGKLADHYKEEVIEIYRNYILATAKSASNRSHYREVSRKVSGYKEIADKQKVQEVIVEMMALYKKKPAFLDELSKVR